MRILSFIIVLLLYGVVAVAYADELTDEQARQRYPYAVLDVKEIDFGQVETGKSVTARVHITNEGSFNLYIEGNFANRCQEQNGYQKPCQNESRNTQQSFHDNHQREF